VSKDKVKNNQIILMDAIVDAYASSLQFYSRLNRSFLDALFVPFTDAREELREIRKEEAKKEEKVYYANYSDYLKYQQQYYQKYEKIIMSGIRDKFDINFREEGFTRALSEYIDSYSEIAKMTDIGQIYQYTSNFISFWNNEFIEPIRDTALRTPSHKIYSENKYSLFHYDILGHETKAERGKNKKKEKTMTRYDYSAEISTTPILIIYAFINRHYILDLVPDSSIVRNLQRQGFDIFATDWGTPSAYDKKLTIGYYVNNYLADAIDHITKHTSSDKVSLFGYCWGGNLALMLAALYPQKIKNIVTLATPGDFSKDNNLLSVWTRSINPDSIVDTFGNVPGSLINSAFLLRSPIDYLHKYPHFFLERTEPLDLKSITEFFATEMWLYDSPPVIGEIYRQFVLDCYQNNLFIKNQMSIYEDSKPDIQIDLRKIKAPFLNVIASKDDLVAPDSSKALNNVIGSSDQSVLEFSSGHVGACIGSKAHKELWPKVGEWLKARSPP
jgi:poly[(R)-3-hydroxyalkanoate] polymerase subunit PhaC